MQLFLLGPVVALSMFSRDIVYTMSTAFIAHGKGMQAAVCDVLGDWAGLVSIGVGAAAAFKGGLPTAGVVLAAIAVGSTFGTYGGVAMEKIYERRFGHSIPQRPEESHTQV